MNTDSKTDIADTGGEQQLVNTRTIKKTKKYFSGFTVLLPIAIGVVVVWLMFRHDASKSDVWEALKSINFDWRVYVGLVLAVCCMLGRDFGLTWRFRELTDRSITWLQAWRVDMLCEFTSCVTPSAVGGSSLGMVFLSVEGVEFGRATTLMMSTLLLDELFFVLACPIVVLIFPYSELFASSSLGFSHGLAWTFWVVYGLIAIWTALLFVGIILKPSWVRGFLTKIFSWRLLRRWQGNAITLSDNMIATSKWLRQKSVWFWLKVFGGTAMSWLSRFLVVNVLFLAFVPSADPYQGLILAREFVIWLVLMVSPTPGGAGLSEWLFSEYYGDLVAFGSLALLLAIIWRIVSYYLYLLIGVIVFPGWLKDAWRKVKGEKQ